MTELSKQEKRLEKFIKERDMFHLVVEAFTNSPTGESELYRVPAQATYEHYNRIINCVREGKPFIASHFGYASEIYSAMDLPWYSFLSLAFTGGLSPETYDQEIEGGEKLFGKDLCTIVRLSAYNIEADLVPVPSAMVGLLYPCDGITMLHQLVAANENWCKVPMFVADPPYGSDESSIEYYARELKKVVPFLEQHTGKKLDMDRFREVIKETNKQYELWMEYNELRKAVPCPHAYGLGMQAYDVTQSSSLAGTPEGTAWFKVLIEDAEKLVRAGKGKIEKERIRLLWFDITSLWSCIDIFPWLEEEWGAVVVMDMFAYTPYTLIDTSTEERIFKGLAKRVLVDVPMVRQVRGVADNFLSDIRRIVKDYKIDCVVWPGHMGHKDGAASIGMMREVCREIGVPFLHIGLDLFDKKYTSTEEVKDKFSKFFTAMGLG